MSRLVTFGCSHTYGYGLPDCCNGVYGPVTSPSKFSWSNLLGQLLNLEVHNESKGGLGNLEIWDKMLRYKFLSDDLVIVMWSHFTRYDNFTVTKNYVPTKSRSSLKSNNNKFNWLNDYENAYKNYLIFHHANLYLDSKKIKNYSFIAHKPDYIDFPPPNFLQIPNLLTIDENYHLDKGLDNKHFGLKSHEKLASILHDKIFI